MSVEDQLECGYSLAWIVGVSKRIPLDVGKMLVLLPQFKQQVDACISWWIGCWNHAHESTALGHHNDVFSCCVSSTATPSNRSWRFSPYLLLATMLVAVRLSPSLSRIMDGYRLMVLNHRVHICATETWILVDECRHGCWKLGILLTEFHHINS